MKIAQFIAIAILAGGLVGSGVTTSSVRAQDVVVPGLAEAIQAQDTVAIDNLVASNQNNPAALAQIANSLFAAAQSLKTSNPMMAALFAAVALSTGVLQGQNATAALNIVSGNPAALALLTNPNAPKTGGTFTSDTASSPQPQNPASNPSQNGSQSRSN